LLRVVLENHLLLGAIEPLDAFDRGLQIVELTPLIFEAAAARRLRAEQDAVGTDHLDQQLERLRCVKGTVEVQLAEAVQERAVVDAAEELGLLPAGWIEKATQLVRDSTAAVADDHLEPREAVEHPTVDERRPRNRFFERLADLVGHPVRRA